MLHQEIIVGFDPGFLVSDTGNDEINSNETKYPLLDRFDIVQDETTDELRVRERNIEIP